jgi:hypothetical protein
MDRLVLNDAQWERIAPLIIGRPDQKGSTGRDLPEVFGEWNSIFRRIHPWGINNLDRTAYSPPRQRYLISR